jgi:hypothetical protein
MAVTFVGKTVHAVLEDGFHAAAIVSRVVDVKKSVVDVHVYVAGEVVYARNVPYSKEPKPGTWHDGLVNVPECNNIKV